VNECIPSMHEWQTAQYAAQYAALYAAQYAAQYLLIHRPCRLFSSICSSLTLASIVSSCASSDCFTRMA
jgi:hypothetical protein